MTTSNLKLYFQVSHIGRHPVMYLHELSVFTQHVKYFDCNNYVTRNGFICIITRDLTNLENVDRFGTATHIVRENVITYINK